MSIRILLLLPLTLFFSCSESKDSEVVYDSSAITNYRWKLTSFKTSQPIDLNKDGISSTDMILEFDCMETQTLSFYSNVDLTTGFFNDMGNFSMSGTISGNITAIECFDESNESMSSTVWLGRIKMLNENTAELLYETTLRGTPLGDFQPFKRIFTITNNKLQRVDIESFPTTYNTSTNQWEMSFITITREFSKIQI